MKKMKTVKQMKDVFDKLMKFVERGDEDDLRTVAREFNAMLDNLRADDLFGTEGQCDPRGDQRSEPI